MAVSAYVLISTAMGKASETTHSIAKIPGVIKAQSVTGLYDVIAIVDAEDMNSIGKIVANEIQRIPGIIETITCPTVVLD